MDWGIAKAAPRREPKRKTSWELLNWPRFRIRTVFQRVPPGSLTFHTLQYSQCNRIFPLTYLHQGDQAFFFMEKASGLPFCRQQRLSLPPASRISCSLFTIPFRLVKICWARLSHSDKCTCKSLPPFNMAFCKVHPLLEKKWPFNLFWPTLLLVQILKNVEKTPRIRLLMTSTLITYIHYSIHRTLFPEIYSMSRKQ